MATAAWVDLVIDPRVLAAGNCSRNRRASFLVALVVGSFVGALMHIKVGPSWALLLSSVIKMAVTVTMLFTKSKTEREYDGAIV